jgi:hypothetical protein
MRETIITCDRCGREFRGQQRGQWRLVWPLGFLSGARALDDFTPDQLGRPLDVCLDCLSPAEVAEIAACDAQELRRELAAGPPALGGER